MDNINNYKPMGDFIRSLTQEQNVIIRNIISKHLKASMGSQQSGQWVAFVPFTKDDRYVKLIIGFHWFDKAILEMSLEAHDLCLDTFIENMCEAEDGRYGKEIV